MAEADSPAGARGGITARAVAIGLILVIGFTVAGCFCVFLRYELIGTGYLPRGAICLLLALIAGNAALRPLKRLRRRLALTGRELLLVFMMLLVVGAIAGQEYAQHVYLNLLGIVYYTTPDIAPPELYLDDLNPMLVPSTDREAPVIRWAFEGLPPGRSFPWRPWVVPLLAWTPFFFALYFMMVCSAALLAHRWEQEEKLLYPLVQVPVEMVEDEPASGASLFRSPLMWGAFAFCCLLYTMKGVHAYWPVIPDFDLQKTTQTTFPGPYSAFSRIPYHFYPEMVGIAYLLTSEVGFSLWFFYFLQYAFLPLVGMVVARVICEAGMFIYTSPFRLNDTIFEMAGTDRIGPKNVTLMTMASWTMIRSTATVNMAAVAQGLKIGAEMGGRRLSVMLVTMAAIIVAILTSHVTSLYVIYQWGVPKLGWWPSGSSLNTTSQLARHLQAPSAMAVGDWVALALGAATTWGLVAMRRRFVWWPLHPLGFVTWLGWPIDRYWMSIFIGWLLKVTVVRLGGFKAFNRLRPGAFGLVLGVCVIITFWIIMHFIYPAPPVIIE